MTEAEIKAAFAVPDNHPLFRAVMQLLQDEIDDAITMVANAKTVLQPQLHDHYSGNLELAMNFRDRLLEWKDTSKRVSDDEKRTK